MATEWTHDHFKKLTKKEIAHVIIDAGCSTFSSFAQSSAKQAESRQRVGSIEPCWCCRTVAKKLGLEV